MHRHELTVDVCVSRMPPEDPAFPPGKNSLKREMSKRLWAVLVYQDVRVLLRGLPDCLGKAR